MAFHIPSIHIEGIELELSERLNVEGFGERFTENFQKSLKKIAYEAKDFWSTEAGKRLNTSKDAYQKSLGVQDNGDGSFSVTLAGRGGRGTKAERWLARAVEVGVPSFDMKPGLLDGRLIRRIRLADGNFRMVTPHQVEKWIFPGLEARKLSDTVQDYVSEVLVPRYLKEAVDKTLKEFNKASGKDKALKKFK